MPIYYKVVKGSVGDISRFETDVATFLASGFIPVGGIAINGSDIYQSLARNTEIDPNMGPPSMGPNPSRQQRPGAMMQSAPSTTPR
jgi:hypothetical protein